MTNLVFIIVSVTGVLWVYLAYNYFICHVIVKLYLYYVQDFKAFALNAEIV